MKPKWNKNIIRKPIQFKRTLAIIAAAGIAIGVFLFSLTLNFYEVNKYQTILEETQESVRRQDSQHLREEAKAAEQASMNNDSASNAANTAASTQSFSGTLQLSSYHERAEEVGASAAMFPDAPILLLVLDIPIRATGYSVGDDVPSVREIAAIRVPDSIGVDEEKISIEVQDAVYFPGDVSGLLWDLDLSELESLKAEPHQ